MVAGPHRIVVKSTSKYLRRNLVTLAASGKARKILSEPAFSSGDVENSLPVARRSFDCSKCNRNTSMRIRKNEYVNHRAHIQATKYGRTRGRFFASWRTTWRTTFSKIFYSFLYLFVSIFWKKNLQRNLLMYCIHKVFLFAINFIRAKVKERVWWQHLHVRWCRRLPVMSASLTHSQISKYEFLPRRNVLNKTHNFCNKILASRAFDVSSTMHAHHRATLFLLSLQSSAAPTVAREKSYCSYFSQQRVERE